MTFKGKTAFITGASRGIGLAIALRLASEGANIAIAAKTTEPHPKLEGTIYTAAEAVEAAGGKALALVTDVREEASVQEAVAKTVEAFGGIDICVNNASAIFLAGTDSTPMKRYDLMHQVNARATFLVSQTCFPHLKNSSQAHILTLSPPLDIKPKWFAPHLAYTMSKFGMSMVTLGLAAEWKEHHIAVNSLWPRTTIATAAVQNLLGGDAIMQRSRKPEIIGDAAHWIFSQSPETCSGNFFIDEEVLAKAGITDLSHYNAVPGMELLTDLFVEDKR